MLLRRFCSVFARLRVRELKGLEHLGVVGVVFRVVGLRWPGDSQRESGRIARIDSRESIRRNRPIFITCERFAAIRANLRIDSHESGHLSRGKFCKLGHAWGFGDDLCTLDTWMRMACALRSWARSRSSRQPLSGRYAAIACLHSSADKTEQSS